MGETQAQAKNGVWKNMLYLIALGKTKTIEWCELEYDAKGRSKNTKQPSHTIEKMFQLLEIMHTKYTNTQSATHKSQSSRKPRNPVAGGTEQAVTISNYIGKKNTTLICVAAT